MQKINNFSNLVIYTSTLYGRDESSIVRSELCLNMLQNAHDLGIMVAIKDGGSSDIFLEQARSFDNVSIVSSNENDPKKSMGADRRDSLSLAMQISNNHNIDSPCYMWIEPEKDTLIKADNLERMMTAIERGANIVVPARKEEGWESLPKNQCQMEQRANKRAANLAKDVLNIGDDKQLDLWFGPKMFDSIGAEYFINYNHDKKRIDLWDSIIVPVVEAAKDGKVVSSVSVDYVYSESQKNNETAELKNVFVLKRLEQYAQILKELGDPKWVDFFNENKEQLKSLNEIKKELKQNPNSAELVDQSTDLKREVLKSFLNNK